MKPNVPFIACTTLLASVLSFGGPQWTSALQTKKGPPVIGSIRNKNLFHEGGCSMQLPADFQAQNEKYVFISDFENRGFINADGKDLTLRLDKDDVPPSDLRKGQRERHVYRGEGIEVIADYVVTWVCPPTSESCEITKYDGKITVTRGDTKQTVSVKGICGT